jgi:transposase
MTKPLTIQDFFKRFPDDAACLEHLMILRFGQDFGCPKCGEIGKFRKLSKQPAYTCNCGHHIHPMRGTIFEDTHTPLTKWFYAIYLFTTTRHGVPAKELQRQLGVSYPTAFRMAHLIREHMGRVDGDPPLGGHVEVDETYVGAKGTKKGRGNYRANKTVVMGMSERGGDIITRVVPDNRRATLIPHVLDNVARDATISTDQLHAYKVLPNFGYTHQAVNHEKEEWARGSAHTNTLESFWSLLKRSIRGTHVHVSPKYLRLYLDEFEYRWNGRHEPQAMFDRLVLSF